MFIERDFLCGKISAWVIRVNFLCRLKKFFENCFWIRTENQRCPPQCHHVHGIPVRPHPKTSQLVDLLNQALSAARMSVLPENIVTQESQLNARAIPVECIRKNVERFRIFSLGEERLDQD